jgi:hypothetical protein
MDALNFLTTPLKNILAEIPTPESGGDIFKAFQLKKTFTTEWTKAYWTVRGFFKTGSPAAERMKLFDESADLPELWKTFNTNYVASANFSGIFSLFYQLTGQNHVQKNLLAEFIRQNDLQKRIAQLREQHRKNSLDTPVKALFHTPFTRRVLTLSSTKEKEAIPEDSSDAGDNESESPPKETKQTDSDSSLLSEGRDEWKRVMTSLFNMINQKEHGTIVHKFIKEYLLRGELEQSVFELTEQNTYASLKLFLEFRQPSASNFKTMSTGVKAQESIAPCGQQQCAGKKIIPKMLAGYFILKRCPNFSNVLTPTARMTRRPQRNPRRASNALVTGETPRKKETTRRETKRIRNSRESRPTLLQITSSQRRI